MGAVSPTGTVTFLFSDIEGSTTLWDHHPDEMAIALERHDAILRDSIERHDGYVFSTGGDGFAVVFQRAERAVAAAADAQRQLVSEPWAESCPIRVRMGIHSGETRERGGDYFGPTVNRCSRIMSVARPCEILVSGVTRDVVAEFGLGEHDFRPAGTVVLKGTTDRVTLHSVVGPGLPLPEGELASSERVGNVVEPLSSLVGRRAELAGLLEALDAHRLVTLIGVGGVGKTRLAVEAGLSGLDRSDGTWMVELGLIDDVDEVPAAVSDALRLRPTPGVGFAESVGEWCEDRDLLIVLDNCEHVLRGVARFVGSLLARAPKVRVLATSREPLMVSGEHVVPVPSLSLDAPSGAMTEAMELFVERARAELPSFDVAGNEDAVREICERLDGIPLALELAAARVRGLSVADISSRLDERFRLLTGGRSSSVERHATLRATVDWSYELLDPFERNLFERLSVFAGRFGVDDAVGLAGTGADEFEVIDNLAALVNRSLVARDDQVPEYRMLETLRAYGRERLGDRIDEVRADHAELMVRKVREARARAAGPAEAAVSAGVDTQSPEYAAAAEWAIGASRAELAVSIAVDVVSVVWLHDGPGRWLASLIDPETDDAAWLPDALFIAANHAMFHEGNTERGETLALQAIELDPSHSYAYSQACIASMFSGDRDTVVERGQLSAETAGDDIERTLGLMVLGNALLFVGRLDDAGVIVSELQHLGDSTGYPTAIATAHHLAGRLLAETDPDAAIVELRAGLTAVEGSSLFVVESNLLRESIPVLMRIDPAEAINVAARHLRLCDSRNDTGQVNNSLAYLATILRELGAVELAALTAGHIGSPLLAPSDDAVFRDTQRSLREALGDDLERLLAEGRSTPTRELIRRILEILTSESSRSV